MRKICMLLALLLLALLPQAQAEGTAYFPHGTTHIAKLASPTPPAPTPWALSITGPS